MVPRAADHPSPVRSGEGDPSCAELPAPHRGCSPGRHAMDNGRDRRLPREPHRRRPRAGGGCVGGGGGGAGAPPPPPPPPATPDIARLGELLALLRSMPLSAPVHNFAITSPFGYRTDPFNGEPAIHEGIDLQARFRAPV